MAVTAEQKAISYVINALFNALPSMASLIFVWAVVDLVKKLVFVPIEFTRIVVCYFFVIKRTVLRDCDQYKLSMLAAMLRNKKNWSGKAVWQSTSRNIKWSEKTSEEKARYKKDLAAEMESIFTPEMIPTEKDITALLNATKNSPFEVQIPEKVIKKFLKEWQEWVKRGASDKDGLWQMIEAKNPGKPSDGAPSICWTGPDAIASMYETAVTAAVTATRARHEGKSGILMFAYRICVIFARLCMTNLLPDFQCYFFGGRRSSNHLLLSLTAYLHCRFNRHYKGSSNLGIHLLFMDAFGYDRAKAMLKAPAGTIAHQYMMAWMAKGHHEDAELMLPISQVTAHLDFWLQTGILALLPDCLTSKATAALMKVAKVSDRYADEWAKRWPSKKHIFCSGSGKSLYDAVRDSGRSVARQDSGRPSDFYALFPPKFMCMASEIGSLAELHENVVTHGIQVCENVVTHGIQVRENVVTHGIQVCENVVTHGIQVCETEVTHRKQERGTVVRNV
jgi:nicotinic acid phosphoribosyltransferase